MIRKGISLFVCVMVVAGLIASASPAQAQLPLIDDYSDAPASYGSANHGLISGALPIWMGDIVLGFDPDFTDQPSVGAIDDDCNTVEGGLVPIPVSCLPAPLNIVNELLTDADNFLLDDEDGVNIGPLVPGAQTPLSVSTTDAGFLDAWIDWAGNGVFDASDQIFNDRPLVGGENALLFTVPNSTTAGLTYARFRFGSSPVAGPTGSEADGEVEDYGVVINQDFGDAPDNPNVATDFPTVLGSGGVPGPARHRLTNLRLGDVADGEANGITSPNSLGDDANPIGGPDDEDGITFVTPWVAGNNATVRIKSNATARVDAWADFNNDLDWADAGEQIFDDEVVNTGFNTKIVSVPSGAVNTSIASRWRLSTDGVASFTGLASDGEVEDHQVAVNTTSGGTLDFGDAPDPYPTTDVLGASHSVGPLFLGDEVDAETDGQPNATATGDDTNPLLSPDDEDGVDFSDTEFAPGLATTVNVKSSGTGFVDAFLDANGDGDWLDEGEQVIDSELVTACGDLDINNQCTNTQEIGLTVPPGDYLGSTYMRFRLTSGGANTPEGFLPDGEVEDYQVSMVILCGSVIDGTLELPIDLQCPGNGDSEFGLFIGASDTEIDLNGHVISGDGVDPDKGISLAPGVVSADDVSIHDGTIEDFGTGIDLAGHRTQFTDLVVERNHGNGIMIDGNDAHFDNVSASNNEGDGANVDGHGLSVVDSNISKNNGDGVQFNGDEAEMISSAANENGGNGWVGEGQNSIVRGSTVNNNTGNGVSITGDNALVEEGVADDNTGHGVVILGNRGRVNSNTSISDNGEDGVRMAGDVSFALLNLAVNNNGGDGIHITVGKKILLKGNEARNNGDDGIDIDKNARGRVNKNILKGGNTDYAIEAHDLVHGKRNVGGPCRPTKLCSQT